MKTKYKYIHFENKPEFDAFMGQPVYACKNNRYGDQLAQIYFYAPWKQYVADFSKTVVFSADCLADIQDFLNQVNTCLP